MCWLESNWVIMGFLILLSCPVFLRTRNFCVAYRRYRGNIEVKNMLALSLNRNSQYELMRYFILIPIYWKGLETMTNPVAMNTPTTHILKYHFPQKETRTWRNGWFQVWGRKCTGYVWNNFSYQIAKKPVNTIRVMSEELRSQALLFKDGTI